MTRNALEKDSKERIMITDQVVECKIDEKKTDHADSKSRLTVSIMENDVQRMLFYLMGGMKVTAVTDEAGFAIPFCREGSVLHVIPMRTLKKGDTRELVFYCRGQIAYKMGRNTLHYNPSVVSPFTGYLQCMTLDLLVKTPKPQIALSVGKLVDKWEEDDYNVSYWKSDECIRFWSFIYGPYDVYESEIELPDGKIPFSLYYKSDETIGRFSLRMANKRRVVDETEGVMNWLNALYGDYPYPKLSVSQKTAFSFREGGDA